ncbi:MAG TPA: hypothetical protein VFJ81_03390, partial [Gemmatimonadales bacterium]|nr:hypothetical protein [Gemmatimonadales bacterium]
MPLPRGDPPEPDHLRAHVLALLLLIQTATPGGPPSAQADSVSARVHAAAGAEGAGVAVPGQGSPTADIPRIEPAGEVRVDGVLDEPVWRQATRLTGFWQYQPVDSRAAEEATEVLVWYAPDAIWFGIVAHDKVPSAIRATVADRDNIANDDNILLDIDTFHD